MLLGRLAHACGASALAGALAQTPQARVSMCSSEQVRKREWLVKQMHVCAPCKPRIRPRSATFAPHLAYAVGREGLVREADAADAQDRVAADGGAREQRGLVAFEGGGQGLGGAGCDGSPMSLWLSASNPSKA